MSFKEHINYSIFIKGCGFIGTVIAAWVFLTSTFVMAADYHEDSLTMQATLIEMQIDIIEDRIERAEDQVDPIKVEKLKHRRNRLERKMDIVMEKQLEV